MRLILLFAAYVVQAAEEKLTPTDRAQIELADTRIKLAETEYQKALLLKNAVIANICERVDAPIGACVIDTNSGLISKKKPAESPKTEVKK
jgi:hypothetical protein